MTESHIVNQDADIEAIDQFAERGVVAVLVLAEVHGEGFGGDLGAVFGGEEGRERVEFGLGARDEDEVVAFCREGEGEFLADAIAGTSDQGPGAAGAEGCEL